MRNRLAVFPQALDVKRDGGTHLSNHMVPGGSPGNASGKAGRVDGEVPRGSLDHEVYSMVSSLLELGLSLDAVLGAASELVAGLARYRYRARFLGMPELTATATHSDLPPSVFFQRANCTAIDNGTTSVTH